MKFMQMPMFTVTTFITTLIVILAFPVFTVVLALMTLTVYLELHSFKRDAMADANVMGKLFHGAP